MNMEMLNFSTTDWNKVEKTIHKGMAGEAIWQTIHHGSVRIRLVEYTPGYIADHWCSKGHILFILDGELTTELQNGRVFTLKAKQSYQVGDNTDPHRSSTTTGALLFIVD